MSGLLANLLRRSKFYSNAKIFDSPIQTLILHKDFCFSGGCLLQKQETETAQKATAAAAADKKRTKESIKISLIGQNNSMTVTSLEEAQKISRRRDLKLIKVQDFDTKTQRPVYRMMSAADLLAEELSSVQHTADDAKSSSSAKKHEKNLNIGSRITEHDLSSRIKNITKWIAKGLDVRVLIQGSGDNDSSTEKIFASVDSAVKEAGGRIVQKQVKHGNIKFNILPPATGAAKGS